jgi:hypothetical protein
MDFDPLSLLFVIVKSVLSGLQRAGSRKGDALKWPYPYVCLALTAPGLDRMSKLVFISSIVPFCRAGIDNGSDQVS